MFPIKQDIHLPYDPAIHFPSREMNVYVLQNHLYKNVHRSFTYKSNPGSRPDVHQQGNRSTNWNVHAMKYFTAIKRNEPMIQAIAWINP